MNKVKVICSVVFFMMIFSATEIMAQDCSYWYKSVGVKNIKYSGEKVNEKNPEKVMEGIECLLKLKGDKSRGAFSGAMNTKVSQLFPRATVEVCALYYISYLFYENFKHASGVALHEIEDAEALNSDVVIKKTYKIYRKWFEKVKQIGLEEARKQKLDPLGDSGITWY